MLVPDWGTRHRPWYPGCQLADTECLARWKMVEQEAELDAESSWGGKSSPCPAQYRHSLGPFSKDSGSFILLLLLLLRDTRDLTQWMTGSREEWRGRQRKEWARPWWWWESYSLTDWHSEYFFICAEFSKQGQIHAVPQPRSYHFYSEYVFNFFSCAPGVISSLIVDKLWQNGVIFHNHFPSGLVIIDRVILQNQFCSSTP